MKKIAQRLGTAVRNFFQNQRKKLRRRALARQLSHSFSRLEPRRVLTVGADFVQATGILTVDITAGGNESAALLISGGNFFLDADGDQIFDVDLLVPANSEKSGALSDLQQIIVNGAAGVGSFLWRGDFTASNALQSVLVQNVNSANIEATANILGTATFSSTASTVFAGDLSTGGDLTSAVFSANGDLQVNGSIEAANGNITLQAADSVLFGATGSATITGNGNVSVIANSDGLDGDGLDEIRMTDGSTIQVNTGTISLDAERNFGGSITLGRLTANINAGTAIDIGATEAIVDGTTLDTLENLSATNGRIELRAGSGGIGAADDIDINSLRLGFNTTGSIGITDLAGGINVDSTSTAGGGGFLTANSPLTISANISVGASTIFTAGDSASIDDDILINNNAVVSLTGAAVDSSLTFNAGDDIVFDTGSIVATEIGRNHTVFLNADLEGAADADRGSITNVAAAGVTISTNRLELVANDGIGDSVGDAGTFAGVALRTSVDTLVATNTTRGEILIQEANGLIIGGTGVRTLAGNGNINIDVDAGNLTVNSVVTADGAGNVTLNADAGTIALNAAVSSTTGSILITGDAINQNAGGNISTGGTGTVTATADNGSITMADGTTTTTATGSISYSATDNVALSQLISTSGALNVTADSDTNGTGAISDNTAAETPNLTTSSAATLNAAQGIGAAGAADIDTAIGTLVATNSTTGNIFIQELNDLILGGSGVRTLAGNGNINIDVDAGNLTVNSVVTADGAGNVTLNADAGTIALNTAVSSTIGSILITGDAINQNLGGNISTGGAGTVTVAADNGGITMVDGSTTTSTNGTITYNAAGIIALSLLDSTAGDVSVSGTSITDNDDLPDSLDVRGANVTLTALPGSIGSVSSSIFRENINAIEVIASGNLVASAITGLVALNATVAGTVALTANTAWLESTGDINFVGVLFTVTNLALIADSDSDGIGTLTLGNSLSVVGDLRVEGADIVAADGSIDLSANRLMVYSGQSEILNVTASQFDATTRGDLTVFSSTAIELIDLGKPYFDPPVDRDNVALQTLTNAGSIRVEAAGTINVSDDVIAGNDFIQTSTGSITLRSNILNGNVIINDVILSDAGNILIEAFNDIIVGTALSPNENAIPVINPIADTDNLPVITATSGNITLVADSDGGLNGTSGSITMADGTRIIAGRATANIYDPGIDGTASPSTISLGALPQPIGTAEIRLTADGAITVGSLQTTNNDTNAIFVQSFNNGIIDAGDATGEANFVANIASARVVLRAVQGIGSLNTLETQAHSLSALNAIGVLPNAPTGDIRIQEIASGGDIRFVSLTPGSESVRNDSATGNITLIADAGAVAVDSSVIATTGSISITGDAVNQNAGGNIATGGAGTVTVTADNGDITMTEGATTTSSTGTIAYSATGNVALSQLISNSGALNVTADSDGNGSGTVSDNTIAETANLTTSVTATLTAAQGIGAAGAADIDTTIGTLVATNTTTGDIIIQETNGLAIGGTGVRTQGGNGNINIDVDAGNLTVNSVVTASGTGNITLNADAGAIALTAVVSSTTGSILITGDTVNQNAGGNIATGGAGTVTVTADNGGITMIEGVTTTTTTGSIAYSATGNVALSQLISNSGALNVTADSDTNGTGAVTDNTIGETANLVSSNTATLNAAQGIGAAGAADIDTTIGTLVATITTTGDIVIQETNGLILSGTGVRTLGGNGNIIIDVIAGNLTANSVVTTNGTGNILLRTFGVNGNIQLNAEVKSGKDVTLSALDGWIDEGNNTARVEGDLLTIKAGKYSHLSNTFVNTLDAEVGSNGNLNNLSSGIDWQKVNSAAANRGDDLLANLKIGLRAAYTGLSDSQINQLVSDFKLQYETRYANQYSLFLVNQKALTVNSVSAGTSANPNVYIETDRASDLTINGIVTTKSNVAEEGGIVLVAGGLFALTSQGKLETTAVNANPTQVVYNVPGPRFVNAQNFFDGGEGVPGKFSTREVLNAFNSPPSFALETPTRHFFQQVALNFGYTSPAGAIDTGSNENGFVVFVGYADGKANPFSVGNKPLDTQVFIRSSLFESRFLQDNQILPTNAIVRRANDFFIFENASKADGVENSDAASPIRDLTFQYESIDNVVAGGNGGAIAVPPNPLPQQTPILVAFTPPAVISNVVFQPQQVELEDTVEKPKTVAIYFVNYDDLNLDGQPDLTELPSQEKILKELDTQSGVKEEPIYAADGGSPTPQDIESKKAQFLEDPSKPSGFYAIVEKPANGVPVVLEVFPVRDSAPKAEPNTEPAIVPDTEKVEPEDIPIPVPKIESPKNETSFIPPTLYRSDSTIQGEEDAKQGGTSSARFAASGLLFGSLWMVRESSKSNKSRADSVSESIEELGTVGYSSRDRRNRKLRSILGE